MANKKIAIGTAQFGLNYGVANDKGKTSFSEIEQILVLAQRIGINTLDTAIAYGDSEANLGAAQVKAFQVITKLPPLPDDCGDVGSWIRTQIEGSLGRLKLDRIEAVLLHRSSDIIGPQAKAYQTALLDLKNTGLCNAVGLSIYAPADLDAVWQHSSQWRPDLIQAPFNVLDRRLLTSGWLTHLQQANIRVHTRSAFLQGLLLMPASRRPAWFAPWTPLLNHWLAWCADHQLSPLQAALQFACSHHSIEKVIVGVDTTTQLREIVQSLADPFRAPPAEFVSEELNLIDPSHWKLA
jgi:aryl-alcohol dehydrogenase-like predicted oxidoreductase